MTDDIDMPETYYPPLAPMSDGDALTTAINRLASAIEHIAYNQSTPPPPQPVHQNGNAQLAPLPVMNQARPGCPQHGVDRVKPSTKGPGFFCSAKDPAGPRGYCSWHS